MITPEITEEIAARVEASTLSEMLIAELRKLYPGVHFTYCMDDDMRGNPTPFVQRPGFNLYLVGGDGHCSSIVGSPETASGLVLAEVVEDED
jgi:hypothetical protein